MAFIDPDIEFYIPIHAKIIAGGLLVMGALGLAYNVATNMMDLSDARAKAIEYADRLGNNNGNLDREKFVEMYGRMWMEIDYKHILENGSINERPTEEQYRAFFNSEQKPFQLVFDVEEKGELK